MSNRDTGLPATTPGAGPARPAQLVESAKGWHGIQLAVLGFIGLCGVLWDRGDIPGPDWLQWMISALIASSIVLACLAIYLVGSVAYPFGGVGATPAGGAAGRLRSGVWLTYLAVAVLATGTLSAWWPADQVPPSVELNDAAGRGWCGQLTEGPAGTVRLDTSDGQVTLRLSEIATIRSVDSCG